MIDCNATLYNHLTATTTALYGLVGARIYTPHVPTSFTNSQAAVEFLRRSGTSQREHETLYPSFQFKCFGGTANVSNAEAVYRALSDVLRSINNTSVSGGVLLQAQEETMGSTLIDPDSGWPYVVTFWRIVMRPTS